MYISMKKKMRIILLLSILFISATGIQAGTTGKIYGRITDFQTREGLPGVNVIIEELNLGAVTDNDGYYFILNVPVGFYSVKAYMISYKENRKENLYIGADMSLKVNFTMYSELIEMDTIIVTGDRSISKNVTQQEKIINKELLNKDVGTDITAVIKRQPGVVEDASGKIHIRGGRDDEVAYMIDGMSINNPLYRSPLLTVNKMYADEIRLITGGFNAEYGEAMSGIVNILSKEGKKKLFGHVMYEGNSFLPRDMNNGDNHIQADLGGPVYNDYLKFFVSGEIYNSDYFTPKFHSNPTFFYSNDDSGYAFYFNEYEYTAYRDQYGRTIWDSTATYYRWTEDSVPYFKYDVDTIKFFRTVDPHTGDSVFDVIYKEKPVLDTVLPNYYNQAYMDSLGHIFPHNRHSEYNAQGKLTFTPNEAIKINTNYMVSKFSSEILNNSLKYNPDRGLNENNFSYQISTVGNILVNRANLIIFTADRLVSRSTLTHGFPESFYVLNTDMSVDTFPAPSDYYVEWYEIWRPYSNMDENSFEHLPAPDQRFKDNNPWGFNPYDVTYSYPYYYGMYRNFEVSANEFKLDWQSVLNKYNEAKFGFSFKTYDINMTNLKQPWSPHYAPDRFSVSPVQGAFYMQDRLEFEMMVFNMGFRVDYFNANTAYYPDKTYTMGEPLYVYDTIVSGIDTIIKRTVNVRPDTLADSILWPIDTTTSKINLSPRFGISYPMLPNTYFRFNYGHFYQTPQMANLYAYNTIGADNVDASAIMGNPNLQPEHSISYEIQFESEIVKNFFLSFSAFYKDFYNLVGARFYHVEPYYYYIYENSEYANSKGVEISAAVYEKMYTLYFSYTLLYAFGSSSSTDDKLRNYSYYYDPETGDELSNLTGSTYTDFDQRHTFNMTYSFNTTPLNIPDYLKDGEITVFQVIKSGKPYTLEGGTSFSNIFINDSRMPWGFYTDMKFSKKFTFGSFSSNLYAKVTNVFNIRNIINVYPSSGEPDNDGTLDDLDPNDFTETYKIGDPAYDCRMDLNNDGYVTPGESYTVHVEAYKDYLYNPHNYASPRTVMIGIDFSF